MKTENMLRAVVLAALMAFSLSFAGSPDVTGKTQTKQIPNTCLCKGAQDMNQGAGQSGSMKGGSVAPNQKSEKKRPVDEVDWNKVLGETG
jgi:hypothetical protein